MIFPRRPGLVPSGLNSTFPFAADVSFADYCRRMSTVIVRARGLENSPEREKILATNQPYELRPDHGPPYEHGIVLIHGLSDSPYILKPLARHFRDRGFLVRGILLPGHGTVPGDLTTVDAAAWKQALSWAVNRTRPRVEKLHLCGFSTGGALAAAHAFTHPDEISAMILISPALKIKTALAFAALPLSKVKNWLMVREDLDYARYESFALNGAAQVWRLGHEIKALTGDKKINTPTFMVVSGSDTVIDPAFALDFFSRRLTNPANRAIVYDNRGEKPEDSRIKMVTAAWAREGIIDYSHLSPPMPPDDPHYGRNGDYRNCYHYLRRKKRRECREGRENIQGEISLTNLGKGTIQRLTYNPGYAAMVAAIDRFIQAGGEQR